eukprot:7228897-Pyramimonas_sp.AAC.1
MHEQVFLHLPKAIVLDFDTKEWHLPGWGPGLHPISPSRGRQSILDGLSGASSTECETHATQFMIAPSLAATAHAARGQTTGA